MKTKNFGLLLSIAILAFMALFSEKKVLVTTGYAVTREELVLGEEIFRENCRRCHGRGLSGAPRVRDVQAWKGRIAKGVETLTDKAIRGCGDEHGLMPHRRLAARQIAAAVAYMVKESEESE